MPRRRHGSLNTSDSTSPKRSRRSDAVNDRSERDRLLGGADQGGRQPARGTPMDWRESNPVLKFVDSLKGSELKAETWNLSTKENRRAHHTDEYEQQYLIVRRGQPFDVSFTFSRPYDPAKDKIILQFTTGFRPIESKRTVIRVPIVSDSPDGQPADDWRGHVLKQDESVAVLRITPSASAVVGKYQIFIETISHGEEQTFHFRKDIEEQMCVLFNAWCPDDDVYMANEEERDEYVMNERGRIWVGSARRNGGTPWNFGQFEDVCLDASLYLMDKAELGDGARSNPILVSRMISALANSCDEDNGVLEGRWTETYPKNSTVPWAWSGSVEILEEFMEKRKSVRYGQCWVFSGITTTLLRSLGIPTRSVTNFDSAHDTDCSTTIDYHWGEDGKPLESMNNDSVWNFHVWNESWFKRPDLPEGYDGWQALDATPQECSMGIMRCGPAPVKAIKEGNIYLGYDAPFIFAEVNGDKVHWRVRDDGSMGVFRKEKRAIGHQISTKAVGSYLLNDVTGHYKYPEGSEEERKSVHRAHRYASAPKEDAYDLPEPDVEFALECPDGVEIGQDFEINIVMKNMVEEARNVHVEMSAVVSYYTGVSSEQVGTVSIKEVLEAGGKVTKSLKVSNDDYAGVIKPDSSVKVFLNGKVLETGRAYAHIDTFNLVKPGVTVKVPEEVELNQEFEISLTITNPLQTKLTNSLFHVEAASIARSLIIPHKKAIAPGEEITETVTVSARRSGTKEIVATFSSDQLTGLTGSADVYVKYGAR